MDCPKLERGYLGLQLWAALGMLSGCFVASVLGVMFFENKYIWVSLGIGAGVILALSTKREDFPGSFAGLVLSAISAYVVFNALAGPLIVTVFMVQSAAFVLFVRTWRKPSNV
ncbi:MAG: hypothetical protein UY12_C0014G0015 [Parcubacteria group bacterium GW2011_GWA2_47_8b]|uniref:Uncharacterized protein n=2 Tax=Parcubacteria group TaxID=1794811 RepID=A0A0G1KF89_9BACT|nr:MAG: hypothetical protein UW78_C0002G0036 [Candidatus Azambacteria bacterium GW2011_GWA1_44_9]KKU76586.1 MAG: hypothetical protein UY02_C0017G0008 [Candidatus Giovannonibacteria bacterium GW2011_GWB1_47_6b]KKU85005.1 MAG: hypothetical protein UY12_C0014G0015 [Parcubacteria group bacterium GW2011_GWA2_47_8b]